MLSLNPISLLFIIVIFNGVFFFCALLVASNDRKHFAFLFSLLPILTLIVIQALIYTERWYRTFPHLLSLIYPMALLIGPLFYLFVKSRVGRDNVFAPTQLLHFIPFTLAILFFRQSIFAPYETKIAIWQASLQRDDFTATGFALMIFKVVLNSSYLFMVWRIITAYQQAHGDRLTREFASALQWLKRLTILILSIWPVYLLAGVYLFFTGTYHTKLDYILYASFATVIHAVAYVAIRKPTAVTTNHVPVFERMKYANSALPAKEAQELLKKLSATMVTEKIYRDSNLTLPKLADYLNIPAHTLSQLLSQHLNVNFNDYINRFRVEEARGKLLDPAGRKSTNLAIAFEVGFGSKASFNRAFKKVVGKTPSRFAREQH